MGYKTRLIQLAVGAAACVSLTLSVPILTASSGPSSAVQKTDVLQTGIQAITDRRFDDAESLFTKAIEKDDLDAVNLALAYHHRGIARQKLGLKVDAIDDYTKAIAMGVLPNDAAARAHYNRALVLASNGDSRGAELDYGKAIELSPDSASAYHNRANLELQRKDYATAIRDYSAAISRLNGDKLKMPLLGRSIAYEKSGNSTAALADFNAALTLDPKYVAALNKQTTLLTLVSALKKEEGQKDEGQKMAAKANDDEITGSIMKADTPKIAAKAEPAGQQSKVSTKEAAYRLQLGAFKESGLAGKAWSDLLRREARLANLDHHVEQADLGPKGTYYRLQAGTFASRAEARSQCASLASSRIDCMVVAIR